MTASGTFRTCQVGLTMSVHRGILLQKSKIELLRKSREGLDVSTAAKVCRADTKVRSHFCIR